MKVGVTVSLGFVTEIVIEHEVLDALLLFLLGLLLRTHGDCKV